jgi:membrane associated rhomboid family serine protease
VSVDLHVPCQKEAFVSEPSEFNVPEEKTAPALSVPPIVLAVVGLLVGIHLALQQVSQGWQVWVQYAFAFVPLRFGPAPFPQIQGSAYWSLLTYGLLHADWLHVGFNSLWLLIFSKPVALRIGTWRYVVLLEVSVAAGALAGLIVHWNENVTMVGISAGVSGVMAAAIPLIYAPGGGWGMGSSEQMALITPLSPKGILTNRTALSFTIMWLALTMFTATSQYLTGTAFLEERVVAWEAHLGGFIAGLVVFYLLDRKAISS